MIDPLDFGPDPEKGMNKKELVRYLKKLSRESILESLTEWQTVQKALDAQLDHFCNLTGAQPDSDLLTAIYAVAEAHTEAVARLVGDKNQWMSWWKFECKFGVHSMRAGINGKKLRLISSLKQLAGLIAE